MNIEIKKLESIDEFFEIVEVQKAVWKNNPLVLTSPHLVKVQVELGAVALGAIAPDGRIVGFVFGFTGCRRGEQMHWSHMLGVIPEFRGIGLGKLLKWKQREEILKNDLDLCCWTFDPLQAVNARLNLVALGATAGEYLEDTYSTRDGYLDGGLPTDRFVARWELNSPRVMASMTWQPLREPVLLEKLPLAFGIDKSENICRPGDVDLSHDELHIGVPIPADINGLRNKTLDLAQSWRSATREVFVGYLKKGYVLTDSLTPAESGSADFLHILRKK